MTAGTVVLLFTDLVDASSLLERVGEEKAERICREHFDLVRRAATARGLDVKNLGHGLLVAVPSALEGVMCALDVQRAALGSDELAVRVGLHVGDPVVDEADYFSPPVTVARRACGSAEAGQILATALVEELTRHRSRPPFKPVGGLEVHGLGASLDLYDVEWQESPAASWTSSDFTPRPRRTEFVGRDEELSRLSAAWLDATAGTAQTTLVAGEPGIGKTRVVEQFAASLPPGTPVLWGRCEESSAMPYQPFLDILNGYVADRSAGDISALVRVGGAQLALLLPALASYVGEESVPGRLDPETERYRLFEAVTDIVRHASARGPALLVIEDAHWADRPTVLLLIHILRAQQNSPLLCICTYRDVDLTRDDPFAAAVVDLRRDHRARRMRLSGLSREEVETMVVGSAQAAVPATLVDAIWSETDGNALFIEEVLLDLESRRTSASPDFWVHAAFDPSDIPQGIREAVEHRLRRLSGDAERTLIVAAVVGREFSLDVVALAGEFSRDAVLEVAEEAAAAGLISESPDRPVGVYRFAHSLTHRAVYDAVSTLRRVRLHGRVGRAIEEVFADSLEQHLSELAFHFGEAAAAGDVDKAVTYAAWAGERAVEVVAYEDGAAYFERALRFLDSRRQTGDAARRLELLVRLGQARLKAGDVALGRTTLLEAAAVARSRHQAETLARLALSYGGDVWRFGYAIEDPTLLSLLEEALDAVGTDDSPIRVRLLARTAAELYYAGDIERRTRLTAEAVDMAARLGDRQLQRVAAESSLLARLGPDLHPDQLVAEATAIAHAAEHSGDMAMAIRARHVRLTALVTLGDLAGADAEAEASTAIALRHRMPSFTFWVDVYEAMRALLEGRLEEGAALAAGAFATGQRTDEATATANYGAQLIFEHWARGQLADVEPAAASLIEDFPRFPAYRCALAFVRAELERDDTTEPFEYFAAHDFANLPRDDNWLVGMWLLAFACAYLHDVDRAQRLYALLAPFEGRVVVQGAAAVCTGSAHSALGVLAATAGQLDVAVAHFRQAIDANRRLGAAPVVAYVQYHFARAIRHRAPADAASLCAEAAPTARAHGMAWLSDRCERLATGVVRDPASSSQEAS